MPALLLKHCLEMTRIRFVASCNQRTRTMSSSIPRDVQEFITGYPTVGDDPHVNDNLRFYRGELKVRMGGRKYSVDSFHEAWEGDYDNLGV